MEDIILNKEESIRFIEYMVNPNQEMIERRDKFLKDLENTEITFKDDEIIVKIKDITL